MRQHCCYDMRTHLEVSAAPAALARPGRHVVYDPVFDEYCLVGDGGLDAAPIAHCPWCGAGLPGSKRSRWFADLAAQGLSPDDPDLDERYQSDLWWATEDGSATP